MAQTNANVFRIIPWHVFTDFSLSVIFKVILLFLSTGQVSIPVALLRL